MCILNVAGRLDYSNLQWKEINQLGGCCSDQKKKKRLWQFGPNQWWWKLIFRRYMLTWLGVSTVLWGVHVLTLGILTNNMWERYSFPHFIDKNTEACRNLSKIQVINNRTRTHTHGYATSKPTKKSTVQKLRNTVRKRSLYSEVLKLKTKASWPISSRSQVIRPEEE